ncbi:phospho-N-acetylmuramoyl-pentapeptide-transferase [Candidatus Gottesmanbacteria bacterium]|nr:phospho-N-acetylmuramoyl-pentapeptide-transferase [Candidatus Gottesmanbacteria bacterium]
MGVLLGLLLFSFIINSIAFVPFINLLYKLKLQRRKQKTKDAFENPTPIFDKFHALKAGTPVGGGVLVIFSSVILFLLSFVLLYYFWIPITTIYPNFGSEVKIILFAFIAFGALGLYDDIKKTFGTTYHNFFGLRLRHKLVLEIILAAILSFWLYTELKISFVHLPFFGVWDLGIFYIPFAIFVIVAFTNAFNITDGLDGLASGLLMIALISFWVISRSILDTAISNFIAIWLGGLIAFLYFNIYPARLFLGDVGSLSFGATLAVIGLLLGKVFSLLIIGGFFVAEVTSSLIQLISKKYTGKRIFHVAPLHLWLQSKGWPEGKVVMRAWLIGVLFSIFGLWLAFIK